MSMKDKTEIKKKNHSVIKVLMASIIIIIILISIYSLSGTQESHVNLIDEPGFENQTSKWEYILELDIWKPFSISDDVAHSGNRSALLRLRADETSINTTIVGTLQNIYSDSMPNPDVMPRKISGNYLVRNWTKGAHKQYIQCVVMAFDVPGHPEGPVQLRYLVSGIDREPFSLGNAKFIIINENQPPENSWIKFERDLVDDFQEYWGFVPSEFSMLRVFFEVRYDDVPYSTTSADVYWDDIYLGD